MAAITRSMGVTWQSKYRSWKLYIQIIKLQPFDQLPGYNQEGELYSVQIIYMWLRTKISILDGKPELLAHRGFKAAKYNLTCSDTRARHGLYTIT